MSRLPGFLLTMLGFLAVTLFGLGTGQPDFVGSFETTGSLIPGWSLSGSLSGTVTTTSFNAGGRALLLGAICAYPCLSPGEPLTVSNTSIFFPGPTLAQNRW